MSVNPLVAGPVNTSGAFAGAGVVESVADLCTSLKNGDWLAAGLAGVGTVMDVAATVSDPFGSLIGAGLGWLMEHLEPLKGWLNDLTGDAGAVLGFAGTWENIAAAMGAAGDELNRVVRADLEAMSGASITAYATYADSLADQIRATGASASAIGSALTTCSMVVQVVHDLVRDTLAQLIGSIISWAAEAIFTVGLATPLIVEQVTTRVSALATKVGRSVTDVITSAKSLKNLLEALKDLLARLGKDLRSKLPGGHARPDAPKVHEPDVPTTHAPKTEALDTPGVYPDHAGKPGFLPDGRIDPEAFVTEPGTAFFWSGRTADGVDVKLMSGDFAKDRGGVTLETLMEERGIDLPLWDDKVPEIKQMWAEASAHYANSVSGDVRAAIGSSLRKGNIWENVELGRLMKNPNVTSITQIDPVTGVEKLLYP